MKKSFKKQFQRLLDAIGSNFRTTKALMKQFKSLSTIIDNLNEDNEQESKLKGSLKALNAQTYSSINELLDQSRELTTIYKKMLEEAMQE